MCIRDSYYVNGEEAEEDSFKNFFNGVVNISAKERLEETYQADGDPELKFIFENEDAREEVSYYIFDENFYVAVKEDVYKRQDYRSGDLFRSCL